MIIMFHQELGSKSRKAFLDSGEEFGARISAEVLLSLHGHGRRPAYD